MKTKSYGWPEEKSYFDSENWGVNKAQVFEEAVQGLRDLGYSASFEREYAGRMMYGDTCYAIITDAPGPFVGYALCEAAICAMPREGNSRRGAAFDGLEWLSGHLPERADEMGKTEMVYY